VYTRKEWEEAKGHCPNKACDGSSLDRWDWQEIRLIAFKYCGKNYPEVPQEGVEYLMYPLEVIKVGS
jgi:hypothetical protein